MNRRPLLRTLILAAVAALLLLCVLVAGALMLAPRLAAGPGARFASQWLHRPVSIAALRLDPAHLALHLEGLRIGGPAGQPPTATLLSVATLDLQLAWRSFRRGYPEITQLRIAEPRLQLSRTADGHLDIQDLIDRFLAHPASGPPAQVVLHDLLISNGRVDWLDQQHGTQHVLAGLQFELPFLSTRAGDAEQVLEPRLYGQLDGHLLVLYGRSQEQGTQRALSAHFEVQDLRLPAYRDVLPVPPGLVVQDGRFDARMDFAVHLHPGALPGMQLSGHLALRDLDLRAAAAPDHPLLALGELDVPVVSSDLEQRRLHLGMLAVQAFQLNARRAEDGSVDWVRLLQQLHASRQAALAGTSSPAAGAVSPSAIALTVDGVDFSSGRVSWDDAATPQPVHLGIRDAHITLGQVQWPEPQAIGFGIRLLGDGGERLALGGLIHPAEARIEAEVRLEAIDPDRGAPYFAGRLPVRIRTRPFDSSARVLAGLDAEGAYAQISGLEFRLPDLEVRARDDDRLLVQAHGIAIQRLALDSRAGTLTAEGLSWDILAATVAGRTRTGSTHLSGLTADWHAGRYQLGTVLAEQLQLPGGFSAAVLNGAAVRIDLPARHYQLGSLGAASLETDRGLRVAALQLAEVDADLAAGRYRVGQANLAHATAPDGQQIGGISLGSAVLDLPGRALQVAALDLSELALGGRFKLSSLAGRGISIDAPQHRLRLDQLRVSGSRLALLRRADGSLDPGSLPALKRLLPEPSAAAQAPSPPLQLSDWQLRLGTLQIDDGGGTFRDELRRPAAELPWSGLTLNLSSPPGERGGASTLTLTAQLGDATTLGLQGTLALSPLGGQLKLALHGARLRDALPWLPGALPLALAGGRLDLDGLLRPRGSLAHPAVLWEGDARLSELALEDPGTGERVLAVSHLDVHGMQANSAPPTLAIHDVLIDGPQGGLELEADGRFNVSRLLVPAADPAHPAVPAAPTPPPRPAAPASPVGAALAIEIGQVDIRAGSVQFKDRYVRPEYNAQLDDLHGTISAISSRSRSASAVDLAGHLQGGASVRVTGTMRPFTQALGFDLKAAVRGFDLGPLSSYSTRFTGFPIVRGKLSFDVSYTLENGQISARNQLTLDQLTLGPRQDIRGIRELPMDLAVSLLKDSDGVIQVDLPIEGTLRDPKFNLGGIIEQLVTRAVERAVTAPFRWLGSLFGGEHAESLGWVAFAAGDDRLDAVARDKLAHLATALKARQGLRLDLSARADPTSDAEGLKGEVFRQKLLVQKIRRMIAAGESVGDVDALRWSDAEQAVLVREAWSLEHPGEVPAADPEALARALRDAYRPDPEALDALAARRARAAQDWLTGTGGIDPARVFVLGSVDPSSDAPTSAQGLPQARVDFTLR